MKVAETRIGEDTAIALQGRLDSSTVVRLEAELLKYVEDGRATVLLDLSGVEYIGGQGLRALLLAQRRAESLGVPFSLCRLPPQVADILAVAGEDFLPVSDLT